MGSVFLGRCPRLAWVAPLAHRQSPLRAFAPSRDTPASFLEDLIDACVMEWEERMKDEGRMMKWGSLSGAFSSFIIHPSPFSPRPDLLGVILKEGRV